MLPYYPTFWDTKKFWDLKNHSETPLRRLLAVVDQTHHLKNVFLACRLRPAPIHIPDTFHYRAREHCLNARTQVL